MKYHKIPVFTYKADESWPARRKVFLKFMAFVACSYVVGVLSLKALTLGSIFAAEALGYESRAHGKIVKKRVVSEFEAVIGIIAASIGTSKDRW